MPPCILPIFSGGYKSGEPEKNGYIIIDMFIKKLLPAFIRHQSGPGQGMGYERWRIVT